MLCFLETPVLRFALLPTNWPAPEKTTEGGLKKSVLVADLRNCNFVNKRLQQRFSEICKESILKKHLGTTTF